MSGYCAVCGRELKKSIGPIGPKCLKKMKPHSLRLDKKDTKSQRMMMAEKYDMYLEEEKSGQEQAHAAGQNSATKKTH